MASVIAVDGSNCTQRYAKNVFHKLFSLFFYLICQILTTFVPFKTKNYDRNP